MTITNLRHLRTTYEREQIMRWVLRGHWHHVHGRKEMEILQALRDPMEYMSQVFVSLCV